MFNLSCHLPTVREPWLIALEVRRDMLLKAVREGKKAAIMVYHHADTSTFRYRCYNPMQATQRSETWQCVYFFMDELETVKDLLSFSSLLIFSRIKWEHVVDDLVYKARGLGIPVLYDIDDLVCDISYLKLVTNTLNVHFGGEADYDFWFSYISRQEFAASMADGFITTNSFLGTKLRERFGKPFQIIINSLNKEQLKISEKCSRQKRGRKSNRPYTIGYFSGTPSHINDFKTVSCELIQLLNDYPDMQLQVVGFMEFPAEMKDLIKRSRVVFKPLVDFIELQKLMAEVDVSIVPLVNNTFTNCKSELKFFEASIVDTATIATPIATYANAIEDGKTGFLCSPGQWYDRIVRLYNEPDLSLRMVDEAKRFCLERYSGQRVLEGIERSYNFFAK